MTLLVRAVRLLDGPEREVDIAIEGDRIVSIVPTGQAVVDRDAQVVDLEGRWATPGYVDHHAHFTMWAKHLARTDVSAAREPEDVAETIRVALASEHVTDTSAFVARGFQDALWSHAPTGEMLDAAAAAAGQDGRAIVVVSHDLHTVWINDAAAARFGAPRSGIVREGAAFAVEQAVDKEAAEGEDELIASAIAAAAARGVTAITDLEMADNPSVWAGRFRRGLSAVRVTANVYPEHLPLSIARGERTGSVVPDTDGLVTVGALKLFADGALNSGTALCVDAYADGGHGHAVYGEGELEQVMRDADAAGFRIALHAIGDLAVQRALDAFEESGAKGTVEHAQMVTTEDLGRFAALGIGASVQPEHALDDRDVTDRLWAGRTERAFPYRALHDAGASLTFSSDAPVAPLDPWFAISAAVHRTRDAREPWEPGNALDPLTALRASWSAPRLEVGGAADLAVLEADPLTADMPTLRGMYVALTVSAGRVTHRTW